MKTLILIPSRLAATRLPGKPLLKINGLSIISHVFKKAEEANIGEVVVATEDQEIVDDVKKNNGQAILTNKNHKTGTDRIFEAFKKLNKTDIDLVLNLQGDEPLMKVEDIKNLNTQMINNKSKLGTLGHSDGDPVLHSITDAILGATKMGDIGQMFSDKSKRFKNIRSTILMKHVVEQMKIKGYFVNNIDINIITQTPKIKDYKKKMIENISKLCEISKSQINIKGKTTEKLGIIGKEKAIACETITSVIKYD